MTRRNLKDLAAPQDDSPAGMPNTSTVESLGQQSEQAGRGWAASPGLQSGPAGMGRAAHPGKRGMQSRTRMVAQYRQQGGRTSAGKAASSGRQGGQPDIGVPAPSGQQGGQAGSGDDAAKQRTIAEHFFFFLKQPGATPEFLQELHRLAQKAT